MTAMCGLAKNYLQLFLARVGVGVGEATLSPSALSILSDYFPREKRGAAIGLYNMGVSVGAGIAFIVGGQGHWFRHEFTADHAPGRRRTVCLANRLSVRRSTRPASSPR